MAVTHENKTVELVKLVPYEKNPNVHPIEQVKAIAESINRYGQYYPIIVDEDMKILSGHGKKLALEYLGKEMGEVRVLHGLTKKQKMKIVVEDNKIQSMSYVDYSKVEELIKEIGDFEIIGFSTDYIETLISENAKDNMGVDFSTPIEYKSNEQQVQEIPHEIKESQENELTNIEEDIQMAKTFVCPHCGKEIYL